LIRSGVEATAAFVTVQLLGKGRKKGQEMKTDASTNAYHPVFDYGFTIDRTKKGQALEFIAYQESLKFGSLPVGYAVKKLKDIQLEVLDPIEIELGKPGYFPKAVGEYHRWGVLSVVLDLRVIQ
jgi:hypothetical protein